ncbi:Integral membrane protein [Rhodovulum sp. P5]|uniref:DUF805 domain-containing protein n=1 Tax=Rhodovulum sp. P5 TaxID=1564506 RepID=UPI0009C261DE|nr:DUF805 domain-containing protein [Rhodovulum sp. P5]ARE38769.1 Integral membrane protein [Rhodovulum sp. P5]
MGFADAVRTCFRRYFTFSGRASRPEYWWFVLFVLLGSFILGLADAVFFGTTTVETDTSVTVTSDGPLAALFSLATLIPGFSAGWRRMHDTGKSGLYLVYPLIVMVGIASFVGFMGAFDQAASGNIAELFAGAFGIILIVAMIVLLISPLLVLWWLTRPSQPGPNQYGPNPHEVTP